MKNDIDPKIDYVFKAMNATGIRQNPPLVEVIIEVPRGGFLKQDATGEREFISPLPCPFNYGSIPTHIGLDGDFLDAVVLGPRLPLGARISVHAWGAIGMIDGGTYEDKLICARSPISPWRRRFIRLFFQFYAMAKYPINLSKGRMGRNSCQGWGDAESALARATPRARWEESRKQ